MKGYKGINSSGGVLRNYDQIYEVGKTYTHTGKIKLCESGFHFCRQLKDVFEYKYFGCRLFEIEAEGKILHDEDKSVCSQITILRELSTDELNLGKNNTGIMNSGDKNSGDENSGNRNSGDWNSGDKNSGNWNSGNRNSGYFNIDQPRYVRVFGKRCLRFIWEEADKPNFLRFDLTETVDEKTVAIPYQTAFQRAWEQADSDDRKKLFKLPNFDPAIFQQISGIDVTLSEEWKEGHA